MQSKTLLVFFVLLTSVLAENATIFDNIFIEEQTSLQAPEVIGIIFACLLFGLVIAGTIIAIMKHLQGELQSQLVAMQDMLADKSE